MENGLTEATSNSSFGSAVWASSVVDASRTSPNPSVLVMNRLDGSGSPQVFINGGRQHLAGRPSLVFYDQLTAGGSDIPAAALPDGHDEPVLGEDPGKSI